MSRKITKQRFFEITKEYDISKRLALELWTVQPVDMPDYDEKVLLMACKEFQFKFVLLEKMKEMKEIVKDWKEDEDD